MHNSQPTGSIYPTVYSWVSRTEYLSQPTGLYTQQYGLDQAAHIICHWCKPFRYSLLDVNHRSVLSTVPSSMMYFLLCFCFVRRAKLFRYSLLEINHRSVSTTVPSSLMMFFFAVPLFCSFFWLSIFSKNICFRTSSSLSCRASRTVWLSGTRESSSPFSSPLEAR